MALGWKVKQTANSYGLFQSVYGWRSKVGLLVPSTNVAIEFEFNKMAPPGVAICAARLKMKEGLTPFERMLRLSEEETERAAKEVADAKVDVIVYGCTAGSFVKGLKHDEELVRKIEDLTSIPAMTTSTSVIEALKELEIKNIALVTPYSEEINKLEEKFLSGHGFNVVNLVSGVLRSDQMSQFIAYKRAKMADKPEAHGIFISCTNFQTIYIIKSLESDLNKPVISSNQATMWYALKKLKIRDPIIGYGNLLERSR